MFGTGFPMTFHFHEAHHDAFDKKDLNMREANLKQKAIRNFSSIARRKSLA
jgi:hypothetical protein